MTPYPTQGPKNYYFLFFKLDFKFSLILQHKKNSTIPNSKVIYLLKITFIFPNVVKKKIVRWYIIAISPNQFAELYMFFFYNA